MATALDIFSSHRVTARHAPCLPARARGLPRLPSGAAFVKFKSRSRASAPNSSNEYSAADSDGGGGGGDAASMSGSTRRETVLLGLGGIVAVRSAWGLALGALPASAAGGSGKAAVEKPRPKFYDLEGSGGVQALDIRQGAGASPLNGDTVVIHYYARLLAKQGWRFDSSYDHKDSTGAPEPYVFVIGDGTVIAGLESALRTMKEGGLRRVIIPPSQGYQNMMQGPLPPNFSDRQRLFTTIFNPTRLANGEGSTLGALVFDVELLRIRRT